MNLGSTKVNEKTELEKEKKEYWRHIFHCVKCKNIQTPAKDEASDIDEASGISDFFSKCLLFC